MLQLPVISLFLRTIPEGILVVLVSYMILLKRVDKRKIGISGVIIGLTTYIIRMLPIYFGIHALLSLIIFIFLLHKFHEVRLYNAVTASISTYILLMVSEWATMIIYVFLLKMNPEVLSQQNLQGILLGMPSLVILLLSGMLIRAVKLKKAGGGR